MQPCSFNVQCYPVPLCSAVMHAVGCPYTALCQIQDNLQKSYQGYCCTAVCYVFKVEQFMEFRPAFLQVSDSKKKRAAAKKAKAPGGPAATAKDASSPNENEAPANGVHELAKQIEEVDISNERSCTSILTSHPQSRDIHLESFTLLFHGHELLVDTDLELNFGR